MSVRVNGCRTPADRARRSHPVTADVRQPLYGAAEVKGKIVAFLGIELCPDSSANLVDYVAKQDSGHGWRVDPKYRSVGRLLSRVFVANTYWRGRSE